MRGEGVGRKGGRSVSCSRIPSLERRERAMEPNRWRGDNKRQAGVRKRLPFLPPDERKRGGGNRDNREDGGQGKKRGT